VQHIRQLSFVSTCFVPSCLTPGHTHAFALVPLSNRQGAECAALFFFSSIALDLELELSQLACSCMMSQRAGLPTRTVTWRAEEFSIGSVTGIIYSVPSGFLRVTVLYRLPDVGSCGRIALA
jgi:hypothetical protein